MTACLPNESIFLLLMLCIYTHCNLPYKPQRREERAREGGGSERERKAETQQASERGEERRRERKKEKQKETERKAQTKPSYQTADSPPSPIQQNATRLMQQQVQFCQTNRVTKVYSLYHYCFANKQFKSSWLHLLYLCSIMRNVLFQFWHTVHVIIINTFFAY